MPDDAIDFATRIRDQGGRLTPQRQLILDTLFALGGHVSAAQLSERVQEIAPAIDRSTVYRTLTLLQELGLISAATVDGTAIYELAPAHDQPHAHLVCEVCGYVAHIHSGVVDETARRLEERHGFIVGEAGLTVSGVCRHCAAKIDPQRPPARMRKECDG